MPLDPHLPLARLHLTVRAEAPLQLPPYAGSMLRGAFGHALQALALLPHTSGQPCAMQGNCPYCQIFSAPALPAHSLQKFSQMPAPYVIEPPTPGLGQPWQVQPLRAGQTFVFGLVLAGRALQHLPTVVLAFERALQRGLGSRNTACTLLSVQQEGAPEPLWQAAQPRQAPPVCGLLNNTTLPAAAALGTQASVQLHLHTPLRLQYQNRPARQHSLNADALLMALARRYQLLLDVCMGQNAPQQDFAALKRQAEAVRINTGDLYWFDWERYSSRQQQTMKLGGLLGTLRLHGDLAPFGHLLHLGQWLHVGKETTFGLGRYTLGLDVAALAGRTPRAADAPAARRAAATATEPQNA